MPLRFAINGLGRVGRALLRIACSRPELELEIVAVNDLVSAEVLARLLARDTVHGPFAGRVEGAPGRLVIDGREIPVTAEPEPARIPWAAAGAEVVVEATGRFTRRAAAAGHLQAPVQAPVQTPGTTVRTVIVSANGEGLDATLCLGINEGDFRPGEHRVVSNASCTTNCLALVAKVLHDSFVVRRALMSTVHSYTENQRLLDLPHPDPRRGRAAALNMIPTSTTAAEALGLVLPQLAGRVAGFAVRVPTPAVAMLDLVAELARPASAGEVRQAFRAAARGPLKGLLGAVDEELVSSDFVGDPRSAVVDLPLIQSVTGFGGGALVRVVAWYDNEWGYANRLADLLALLAERHRN
ncbi:MAG TPA: type I glyceraldehyde-3-phosphate dehydrogenase [Thermoanaerobaculia bacterium]|nr:type I glyceraldehyde-3-phosphate dehydrogenase [Thermoanaerobaculia bacterium]